MRASVVLTLLAISPSRASAQPVRVNVQCEQIGRTKACPAFPCELSRLSYAEPLSMYGSFNVKLHWDRSNGARNDRLEEL